VIGILVSGSIVASAISACFWLLVLVLVRGVIGGQPVIHRALIYLVAVSFLLIDLFTFAVVLRWGAEVVSAMYAFMVGLQTVAALAAVIFVRRTAKEKAR
jgi:hypothetical protein